MRAETKFLLVLAFWFLLFAEGLSWVTASWPGDCIINPEQNAAANNQTYQNNCPTFHVGVWIALKRADRVISRHDKSIIAIFTGVLAISTIGLWTATVRLWKAGDQQLELIASNASIQSRDMEASIAVADRAARAAELSAQASIGLQLPRLVVEAAFLFRPGQPHGADQPYTVPIENGAAPEWSQAAAPFSNVGNTNAFLSEECIEYFVGPRLPETPPYNRVIPLPSGFIIKNSNTWHARIGNRFIHLTTEQREAMETIELSHSLWVYGFLRFTDFLGNPHECRFCRKWDRSMGFVSESNAPPEYTRSY